MKLLRKSNRLRTPNSRICAISRRLAPSWVETSKVHRTVLQATRVLKQLTSHIISSHPSTLSIEMRTPLEIKPSMKFYKNPITTTHQNSSVHWKINRCLSRFHQTNSNPKTSDSNQVSKTSRTQKSSQACNSQPTSTICSPIKTSSTMNKQDTLATRETKAMVAWLIAWQTWVCNLVQTYCKE